MAHIKKKIPTLPFISFLKHALKIAKNPLPFHANNFKKRGDVFALKISPIHKVYFCRHKNLINYVLKTNHKNYTKSKIQTRDLAKYVGKGLLTSEGKLWKTQRKLIQPAFHKKQLEALLHKIETTIEQSYEAITENQNINVISLFNDLAFNTVASALFSDAVAKNEIKYLQEVTEAAQHMMVRELRQPYLLWWFKLSGKIKANLVSVAKARQILKTIVNKRKLASCNTFDLLDMLLDARYEDGKGMEDEQLIDEILILFIAGHETTSNALTFTTQLLALHPEWQEKIKDETARLNLETMSLMDFVMKSKICQQVIEEAMRLYPPAYFVDRVNIENDEFEGYQFKAGSNLLFSMYELHRHPDLWDDPLQFKPERFEGGSRQFSSFYFPFGAGPRKCIGNNFAMFEMIIAITKLVSNYKITPKFKDIEILALITLKPKNAILSFEKR